MRLLFSSYKHLAGRKVQFTSPHIAVIGLYYMPSNVITTKTCMLMSYHTKLANRWNSVCVNCIQMRMKINKQFHEIWYLLHMQAANARRRLHICPVSPVPSLLLYTRPRGYKQISCSTQLSTKFILLINDVGILTFISKLNTTSERLKARNLFICRYFFLNFLLN